MLTEEEINKLQEQVTQLSKEKEEASAKVKELSTAVEGEKVKYGILEQAYKDVTQKPQDTEPQPSKDVFEAIATARK